MGGGLGQGVVAPCDHVVQFYAHDDELVGGVAGYLIDGVQAGGVAVIVATGPHRAVFEEHMASAGVDVAAARAAGAIVSLDARETMARFLVADRPDGERFRAVIGEVIRQATETGRPVHAYGEMVDLLWDAGHVNAAIELEGLWNDLGREFPFSLFCAYRTSSVSADDDLESFREVCALHSAVIGTASAPGDAAREAAAETARSFAADARSPREARHFLTTLLREWGDEALIADAALAVTELATNAVIHARSEFTVSVVADRDRLRVSVADASPARPVNSAPGLVATSGRGLGLVAGVAARWGSEDLAHGKIVWAEFSRSAPR